MSIARTRIGLIDLFRTLAIMLVVLYHYFSSFTYPRISENFYPYHNRYAEVTLFKYGYLGVELFFMVSGFVILLTLENSKSFFDFIFKRFIRLFPSILVCSILTYVLVRVIDQNQQFPTFHRPVISFLPSLTFTEPVLWESVLGKKVGYIDGVYWSLAIEVKFYLLSAAIFYFNKKNFTLNWIIISLIALITQVALIQDALNIPKNQYLEYFSKGINFFFFPQYILFFTMGMLFYKRFSDQLIYKWEIIVCILLFVVQLFMVKMVFNDWIEKVFIVSFLALFFAFIYKRQWLEVLSNRILIKIGLASYSLYLIHQTVGIILINYLTKVFGVYRYPEIFVPIVILIMILFSFVFYDKFEKRILIIGRRLF